MKPRKDGRFGVSKRTPQGRIWGYGWTEQEARDDLAAKLYTPSTNTLSARGSVHEIAKALWHPSLEFLRPLTKRRYMDAYALHIFPAFGSRSPSSINRGEVQEWVNTLSKKLSPSSVRVCRQVLRQIVNILLDEDLITRDPMRGLKMPRQRPKRERYMAVTDALLLLEKVRDTPLSAPVFLASVLGLRRGEICGLRWEDIDRTAGTLRIVRQRQNLKGKGGIQESETKTKGSERTLYPTALMLEELDSRGDLESPYVCTYHGKPWNPERLTRYFDQKKVAPEGWTLHDLRHLAGGLLNAADVSLVGIAAILGHSTTAMSERYVSHGKELRKADMERLDKLLKR